MMKRTKKILFPFVSFLLFIMTSMCVGCSDNDESHNYVKHPLGMEIPYTPRSSSEMPQWLIEVVNRDKNAMLMINEGVCNNQVIYNIYTGYMSHLVGDFYSETGTLMTIDIANVYDLTCIYYYKFANK